MRFIKTSVIACTLLFSMNAFAQWCTPGTQNNVVADITQVPGGPASYGTVTVKLRNTCLVVAYNNGVGAICDLRLNAVEIGTDFRNTGAYSFGPVVPVKVWFVKSTKKCTAFLEAV